MESDGDRYRTLSAIDGGKIVESQWKIAHPKNVGKSNETTGEEQAALEIASKYTDQTNAGGYSVSPMTNGQQEYFEPMLAEKFEKYSKTLKFPYWTQPKLDGVRCTISSYGTKSRNGKPFVTVPHIELALASILAQYPDMVIDGELYNHDLKDNFEKIISLVRKSKPTSDDLIESSASVQFHVYDVYFKSSPDMIFSERIGAMHNILSGIPFIHIVPTQIVSNITELDEYYGDYLEDGYEGQMVRVDAEYQQKRSKYLLKRKEFEDGEFKIVRLEEGEGNWAGAVKRVYFMLEDGECQKAGIRGSYPVLKKMLEEAEQYVNGECTIRYQNKTSDGKLRFPVAVMIFKENRDL